jgi:hypothetical protein
MLAVDTTLAVINTEIQVGVDAEMFTSTETGNAYALIEELVAWANHGTRAWAGLIFFDWSWARDPVSGGALLTLSADAVFDINTATGDLQIPTMAAQTSSTATDPATGTWAPTLPIAVAGVVRMLGEGDAGGSCLVRPGSPGLAGWRPKVEAVGTALDAARLAGILAGATSPRRCYVYQMHQDVWRQFAMGAVSRSGEGATAYRFSIECAGEAL